MVVRRRRQVHTHAQMARSDTEAVAHAMAAMVAGGQGALLVTKLATVSMGDAVWRGVPLPALESALNRHTDEAKRLLDRVDDALVDGTGCRLAARVVARLLLGAQHYRDALSRLCVPWFVSHHLDARAVARKSLAAMRAVVPGRARLVLTLLVDDEPARAMTVGAAQARDDPRAAAEYRRQITELSPYTHTWATVFSCAPDGTPRAHLYMAFSEHYTLPAWMGMRAADDDVVAHMSPGLKPMFRKRSAALIRTCPYRGSLSLKQYAAFLADLVVIGGVGEVATPWVDAYRRAFAVDMATLRGAPAGQLATRFSMHQEGFDTDTLPAAEQEVARVEKEAGCDKK
jgi:hypothetical protein